MAMAATSFNDVAAWILLALAVPLAGGGGAHHSPLISLWVLLSGIGFVVFMFLIIRPIMIWVAQKSSSGNNIVEETYICLTLAGVMLFGFMTDFIGIRAIFGVFIDHLTLGDTTIAEFKMKWGKQTLYAEIEVNNLVNEVLAIGKSGEYELMIVGNKDKFPQGIMAKLFEQQLIEQNNSELGPVANLLTSSGKGIKSSVLVIQQQQANFGCGNSACKDIGNSKVASFIDG
ncbi:hypothetical protein K7X08_015845 [Anisodus acutangulus]|uniref:Cation/H+ exchanger transmembrane domain-containing protein n=1 Tax=Anisodus acutangulus TaxID=402998 RepID=A0A9Q1QXG5_9SOLA|nr:hypothetical protein K7X08_015845 [Anisodus acutangulus]